MNDHVTMNDHMTISFQEQFIALEAWWDRLEAACARALSKVSWPLVFVDLLLALGSPVGAVEHLKQRVGVSGTCILRNNRTINGPKRFGVPLRDGRMPITQIDALAVAQKLAGCLTPYTRCADDCASSNFGTLLACRLSLLLSGVPQDLPPWRGSPLDDTALAWVRARVPPEAQAAFALWLQRAQAQLPLLDRDKDSAGSSRDFASSSRDFALRDFASRDFTSRDTVHANPGGCVAFHVVDAYAGCEVWKTSTCHKGHLAPPITPHCGTLTPAACLAKQGVHFLRSPQEYSAPWKRVMKPSRYPNSAHVIHNKRLEPLGDRHFMEVLVVGPYVQGASKWCCGQAAWFSGHIVPPDLGRFPWNQQPPPTF